jgi:hypothetical protein
VDIVDNFPLGYPKLAAYHASSASFKNCRRFDRLSIRYLLHQQTKLTKLETKLDALDVQYSNEGKNKKKRLKGYDNNADDGAQPNMTEATKAEFLEDNRLQDKIFSEIGVAFHEYGKCNRPDKHG